MHQRNFLIAICGNALIWACFFLGANVGDEKRFGGLFFLWIYLVVC